MKKILVGLSGGVDSAVTVKLLQREGYLVQGVFLKMLPKNDLRYAQILAKQLKINLAVEDITQEFQKEVIDKFIKDYQNGLTPNPCVYCNPRMKFKYLLEVANRFDINLVATGHYAQIEKEKNYFILRRGLDINKDQSYFLAGLSQEQLSRIKLPLGKKFKTEIKNIAEKNKLKIPKSESQDVCFLPKDIKLTAFLKKQSFGDGFIAGNIVDESGQLVGQHDGLLGYTVGQRKGLDLGGDGPFYVVGKDVKKNILLVSRKRDDLKSKQVVFENVNWINSRPLSGTIYQAQIRSQMKALPVKVKQIDRKNWELQAEQDVFWAVAPGQRVVIYKDDVIIGGGDIVGG